VSLKPAEIKAIIDGMMPVVMGEVDALRKRLDRIEGKELPNLADAFEGGWRADKTYRRGSIVQRQGGTYLALAETDERPGDSDHWRLIGRV